MPIDALSVLCAQLTRDLLAIAKFLFMFASARDTVTVLEREIRETRRPLKRLRPCTRSTFRARILTTLSRFVMTTNNSAK